MSAATASTAASPLLRWVVGLVAGVFVVSVAARGFVDGAPPSAERVSPPPGSAGFLPGAPAGEAPAEEPSTLESFLPYLTEASFFALIGFGLGYGAKKMAKLLLILAALVFLAVQGMAYAEVVTVDWSKLVELLNQWVLNIKEDAPFTEVLTTHLASTGALLGGFALGFVKG